MCLLMKHNPMGINKGLCSLEILWSFSRIAREKHKKFYDHFSELLFIEPNDLVVSWRQVCDNPLATRVGGILSKDNNFVPLSYPLLFVFVFSLFFLHYFVYYPHHSISVFC